VIPTLLVLFGSFTKKSIRPSYKSFFFCWFIIMNLIIGPIEFAANYGGPSNASSNQQGENPVEIFLTGMFVFYIVAYLLLLIIEGHNRKIMPDGEIKDRETYSISKFSDEQISLRRSLFAIFVCGGSLILNYKLHVLSEFTLVSMWLLFFPLAKRARKTLAGDNKRMDAAGGLGNEIKKEVEGDIPQPE
jgi:hypothetical protein